MGVVMETRVSRVDPGVYCVQEMSELIQPPEIAQGEVQQFFSGRCVLLTGATGFCGKVLLEKLLRSCPNLDKVYIVVRPRRGQDIYDRVANLLNQPLLSCLQLFVTVSPEALKKVVPVAGDLSRPGLGLSLHDKELLCQQVSVVFHMAASVRFNDNLHSAMETNVWATEAVMKLSKSMDHLKPMRMKRCDYVAVPECKGGVNGRSSSKPTNWRHYPARFPHEKIQEQPHQQSNPYQNWIPETRRSCGFPCCLNGVLVPQDECEVSARMALVYVSTAYSNCIQEEIEEKVYTPVANPEELYKRLAIITPKDMAPIESMILQQWPNTYAFTKAMAETVVKEISETLPVAIFRPSIGPQKHEQGKNLPGPGVKNHPEIRLEGRARDRTHVLPNASPLVYYCTTSLGEYIWQYDNKSMNSVAVRESTDSVGGMLVAVASTWKEPEPGWVDSMNGPTLSIMGGALGKMQCGLVHKNCTVDMVPVDMVASGLIATAWDTACCSDRTKPRVYNFVSGSRNPITWAQFFRHAKDCNEVYPSAKAAWYCKPIITQHRSIYILLSLLLELLPALLADLVPYLSTGKHRYLQPIRS
ncbi:hypothetical protein PR048_031217 [Dryococelus australis]|uniref:Fatty acyl-CoA reductase n=1 Tax=Dryococelus australis TaxID=614101 RepID=A0ABQ9G7D8_9NEOP|nr:hypothetical protein PR048_031217 [Dryococelus australis]